MVEEAATYLSPRFFVHVFGASCVSLGTVLLWQELWKHTGQYSPLFQVFLGPNCSYSEFIYYVSCGVIGLICGLLGCLFNRVVLELNFLRQRWRTEGRRNIFTVEVVVIAILSSSIGTLLPAMTTCRESTIQRAFTNSNQCIAGEWATQIFEGRENLHEKVKMVPSAGLFGVQYNPDVCPKAIYNDSHMPCNLEKLGLKFPSSVPEQERYFYCCGFDDLDSFHKGLVYNFTSPRAPLELFEEFWPTYGCETFSESNISIPRYRPMAALAFVPGRITVKNLFTRGSPNMIPTTSMLVFLPLYFVLAAITSGAAVPSGLVVPMMIIGGCVGRLAGNLLTKLFRDAWTCPSDWTPEYSLPPSCTECFLPGATRRKCHRGRAPPVHYTPCRLLQQPQASEDAGAARYQHLLLARMRLAGPGLLCHCGGCSLHECLGKHRPFRHCDDGGDYWRYRVGASHCLRCPYRTFCSPLLHWPWPLP